MTLIAVLLADEYVLSVSDRRLCWVQGPKVIRREDSENKTIVLCGHYLMGYTGLARIEGKSVQQWVVETLVSVPAERYFSSLAQAANVAFGRINVSPEGLKRHAFLAVGFTATRSDPRLRASGVTVSNAPVALNGSLGALEDDFTASGYFLDQDFALKTVGYPVRNDLMREAIDLIRRYRQRLRARPHGAAQVLVNLVRKVAAESDGLVGQDVLLSVLPRKDVPATNIMAPFGAPDFEAQMTCLSLRGADDDQIADYYGPATVCSGMATMGSELWLNRRPPWSAHDEGA